MSFGLDAPASDLGVSWLAADLGGAADVARTAGGSSTVLEGDQLIVNPESIGPNPLLQHTVVRYVKCMLS